MEVVVVTGAGKGLGRAIARRFARDGAALALLGRGEAALEAAAAEVRHAGGRALPLPVDVADAQAVDAAAARVEDELGPIDVWVNNAMTTVFSWLDEIEPDEYRRATEVTYLGAVWGTRAALTRMLPRDRGAIVQVGSAMAYRGIPLQAPYCGAKAAVRGLNDSLRTELRARGSRVHATMVQLPALNTPQFDHCRSKLPGRPAPVPPVYQPELAADAVHWAARNRRREVHVGVPTVKTVIGSKLAPWLAERYLARTGVDAQLERDTPPSGWNARGNLFEPDPGDPGAHGRFDDDARARSIQWTLTRHRRALAAAGVGLSAAAAGLLLRRG
jgi:NAD(P)-dependent dehydrogenase (short-subunit alcohol dehydrogenase family)